MRNLLFLFLAVTLTTTLGASGPCDIFDAGGTPCVAAHSVVRALYGAYAGPLYTVRRSLDNSTAEIGVVSTGGVADASIQDKFCADTFCSIERIFDQSPRGNHLDVAPGGGAAPAPDHGVNATRAPTTLSGNPVYSAYLESGEGYRIENTSGVATGDAPETMYMVTAGKHYNNKCCFDYGNAETDARDHGAGTMEAVYWGNCGGWGKGSGDGPWVMADLENGLWAGNKTKTDEPPIVADFVTAMVKGASGGFALKAGDANSGPLKTLYDGPRPSGYNPMKKQGAIILGIGGDNSNWAVGTFYEGVMTSGYSTDAVDDAVQANIVAAGYGR